MAMLLVSWIHVTCPCCTIIDTWFHVFFLSSGDEKDLTFPGTNDRESGAKERQVIVIELNG